MSFLLFFPCYHHYFPVRCSSAAQRARCLINRLVLRAEVPLDIEMQSGLTTLRLPNPCLKIIFCTILLLYSPGMLSTRSFPWVLKDKERRDGWGGDVPGFLVHPTTLHTRQHSGEQADPKVVFMLPLHLPSYGGKVEKAMKGRNMSHWSLKL